MNAAEFGSIAGRGKVSSMTTGLPTLKPCKGFRSSCQLPGLGIEVHADEIELVGDPARLKARRPGGAGQAVGEQADGDQMPTVVLADGRGKLGDPAARDFRAGASPLMQGDKLAIVEPA